MLLSVLLACGGSTAPQSSGSAEAWPEWTDGSSDTEADSGADTTLDSADLPPEPEETDECDPDGCIELAEAVDRGYASIDYGRFGLNVRNDGPYPICVERWYTFLSPSSQDAVAGTTGEDEIEPSGVMTFPYAKWGADTASWWCIEHNQFTAGGSEYSFQGERAPTRIAGWTNDASDEDKDGAEDHDDASPLDALPQTQHNTWDYLADRSVFIVGREMNWFEVAGQQSVEVTVVVTNLGREGGAAQVMEKLPPEWVASSVEPAPMREDTGTDGSTVLTWGVSLDAAIEPASEYSPTEYDIAELHYVLTYTGKCHGREIGYAPNVSWIDHTGSAWTSEGSALILQCCSTDDSLSPGKGNGGFGP